MSDRHSLMEPSRRWALRCFLQPGDMGRIISLHGVLYAQEYGYDQTFEAYVATGLTEFVQSFNPESDRVWLAEAEGQVIGSIAVVGRLESGAQLRWFLIHPSCRGLGLGHVLLDGALQFCKECQYRIVFLWTARGLGAAHYLYEQAGFQKVEEKRHDIWGKTVTEEKYEMHLGPITV